MLLLSRILETGGNDALKPVLWSLRKRPVTDLLSPRQDFARAAITAT